MARDPSVTEIRKRRSQADRTTETRRTLISASIRLLHRFGYGGATTERITSEAGVTRGALQHQFSSRTQLMADVVMAVREDEIAAYRAMTREQGRGERIADWPEMLWEVCSRPGGLAVLEILQASRNDEELAQLVGPVMEEMDRMALAEMQERFHHPDAEGALTGIRMVVWSMRGLSLGQLLGGTDTDLRPAVLLFRDMVETYVSDRLAATTSPG